MVKGVYYIDISSANEESRYKPEVSGQLFNFYNGFDVSGVDSIQRVFHNSYRPIIARDANDEVVGAIRASFDGVYAMIWDLQVSRVTNQNHHKLKGDLLSAMVNELKTKGHNFIAAIVPGEEVSFYQAFGLLYGYNLTVTTIDPEKHILWESVHPVRQNDRVNPSEVSRLFTVTGWQKEAAMGEKFANAFNTALCNFTARNEHDNLIGIVRTHFDG